VSVAFHIDDSILWSERRDLISNPDSIETADWKQIPNTGRRADWGPKPTRFPPQMCYNSPDIVDAVKKRAALIGAEVKKEVDALKASGNEHLFANIITGWETRIGRDFETGRPLGDPAPFRHLPCLPLLQGKDARGIAFPKRLAPHYDERVVGGRDMYTTRVGCRLPASTCRS
jgi:hypothetical protein